MHKLGFLPAGLMFVSAVAQGSLATKTGWNWIQAQAEITRARQAEKAAADAALVQQAMSKLGIAEADKESARQKLLASYGVLQGFSRVNFVVPAVGLGIFGVAVLVAVHQRRKRKKSGAR